MDFEIKIRTASQRWLAINTDDPNVSQHFNSGNSYATTVLNEINQNNIYDYLLQGANNITVLDIGANIGLFSLYASPIARKIYAFEPTPAHYKILTTLTGQCSNVVTAQTALSDNNGTTDFYINDENTTMNSLANTYGKKINVQSVTLKTLLDNINEPKIDFVKCDIEGGEMVALCDATVGPVSDRIKVWYIECHSTDPNNWDASLQANRNALATMFVRQGYQVHKVNHDILYAQKD